MCDSLYCALGRSAESEGRAAFFGKNSDRRPEEPQTLCLVHPVPASETAGVGAKQIPWKNAGYCFILSKPSWMAGGEMGVNEKGVAIGNEAVFSRFKPAKDGVLGMDILRAALGLAATAKEAVDFICAFVERFDQGGNGSFRGSLYYDNSFLISDPREAYILETAGRRWAWRLADSRDAISNAYCIDLDYKRLDTQSRKEIAPVNERAACSDEADPGRKGEKESFKAQFENRFYLRFTKGEQRRALSLAKLGAFANATTVANAKAAAAPTQPASATGFLDILRSHGPYDPFHPWKHHMESLCVHAGGFPASATTASMAVEYSGDDAALIWFTGSPYPCVSLYKPILLVKGEFILLWSDYDYAEGSEAALAYWKRCRYWAMNKRGFERAADPAFASGLAQAQESLEAIARKALSDLAAAGDLSSLPVLAQEAGAVIAGWEQDCGI
jgi:hypothetical protein